VKDKPSGFKTTKTAKYPKKLGSKEYGPRGPGFDFTPEGWSLPLDVKWNDGMSKIRLWRSGIMEYWV